jgi:hypothetical protein
LAAAARHSAIIVGKAAGLKALSRLRTAPSSVTTARTSGSELASGLAGSPTGHRVDRDRWLRLADHYRHENIEKHQIETPRLELGETLAAKVGNDDARNQYPAVGN